MTDRKLSKQELCRLIVEKLEPMPSGIIAYPMVVVSLLGFWRGVGVGTGWIWDPVRFFDSEDASARLLEAMPDPMLHHIVKDNPVYGNRDNDWGCKPTHDSNPNTLQWHKDRRTAIVLAAKVWLKIEGEVEL